LTKAPVDCELSDRRLATEPVKVGADVVLASLETLALE
jgi:hypothetical protein